MTTGIRVRTLLLTERHDDGRQALVIELDDEQHTRLVFYGELFITPQVTLANESVNWALAMRARPAGTHPWGVLTVHPPPGNAFDTPFGERW